MASFLILWVLLSGSVLGTAIFHRKFCEVLPITCMTEVFVLYCMGLVGLLKFGVSVILLLALVAWLAGIVYMLYRHEFTLFCKNFFTPAFFLCLIAFVVIIKCNSGMLAFNWDEFTHWIDSVKAMTTLDDFATNPLSNSMFQSYPPAMTLFQYLLQKLAGLVYPEQVFFENLTFVGYQLFTLSILVPFLRNLSFRTPGRVLGGMLMVCCLPLVFYHTFYQNVQVDCAVAVFSGAGLASILFAEKKDGLYRLKLFLLCFTLVLLKDVGLYFAAVILIVYAYDVWIHTEKPARKNKIVFAQMSLPLLVILTAKLSWNMEVARSHVPVQFGQKLRISTYLKIFFFGGDTTYRQVTVDNFKNAFFDSSFVQIGNTGVSISYFFAFAGIATLLFVLARCWTTSGIGTKEDSKSLIFGFRVWAAAQLFYVFNLGLTYISRFTEGEAMMLASYSRYMNIAYGTAAILLGVGIFCLVLRDYERYAVFGAAAMLLFVVLIPGDMGQFLRKENVARSNAVREPYQIMQEKITQTCDGDDRICFISQGNEGFDYMVTRFNVRPNRLDLIDGYGSWNVGASNPTALWPGKDMCAEEFLDHFTEKGYEYLALYRTDTYFTETYADLFEEPAVIQDNSLFWYDAERGVFAVCQ